MSDAYEVNGVTITPVGGGYYDLTHPTLAEPVRVRGKEVADQRAAEIAAANPQQTAGDENTPLVQPDIAAAATPPVPPAPPEAAPVAQEPDPRDDQIAALTARLEALETAGVRTVLSSNNTPVQGGVPLDTPREYSGRMDPKVRERFEKSGFKIRTILLEENESIPPTGLFVSHNGNPYMIAPGEEVDVPDFLTGILDDAIMSAPVVDSKTQKVLGYRNRSKYPYRVISE